MRPPVVGQEKSHTRCYFLHTFNPPTPVGKPGRNLSSSTKHTVIYNTALCFVVVAGSAAVGCPHILEGTKGRTMPGL